MWCRREAVIISRGEALSREDKSRTTHITQRERLLFHTHTLPGSQFFLSLQPPQISWYPVTSSFPNDETFPFIMTRAGSQFESREMKIKKSSPSPRGPALWHQNIKQTWKHISQKFEGGESTSEVVSVLVQESRVKGPSSCDQSQ